jgi:predicted Rossmann fold nucleotide-binding protein DprA/Smf involved in DNA uptake
MIPKNSAPRINHIRKDDEGYPIVLRKYLGNRTPAAIAALGNPDILRQKTLALFCSVKCPGNLILKTYDLARQLRDDGVTVISGFHSPMEKECLTILLRGKQPIIICPARSLEKMRISKEWRQPLDEGRLLILSPFSKKYRRATVKLAKKRNEVVSAMADRIFIAYAAPGSKTEDLCRKALSWDKTVSTFDTPKNANLVSLGAKTLQVGIQAPALL